MAINEIYQKIIYFEFLIIFIWFIFLVILKYE